VVNSAVFIFSLDEIMCDKNTKKGIFEAKVNSNRCIGEGFYRINLGLTEDGAKAFAGFVPGQFVEIDLSTAPLPAMDKIPEKLRDSSQRNILLRRPFSLADVQICGNTTNVEILYCSIGPASLRMTQLKQADLVSVIGPLGNGFSIDKNKKVAILAVGGMGAGPLQHLAGELKKNADIQVIAFAGAQSLDKIPFEKPFGDFCHEPSLCLNEFSKSMTKSIVATDDGSAGVKGFVTTAVENWLENCNVKGEDIIIYCCGPEAMLAAMANIAQKRNIDCQVSMERQMACGIGLCQSCAVECKKEGKEETFYKMCCKDGPVFDSREVVF